MSRLYVCFCVSHESGALTIQCNFKWIVARLSVGFVRMWLILYNILIILTHTIYAQIMHFFQTEQQIGIENKSPFLLEIFIFLVYNSMETIIWWTEIKSIMRYAWHDNLVVIKSMWMKNECQNQTMRCVKELTTA